MDRLLSRRLTPHERAVLVTMEPRLAPGAEDPEDHHGRWNVLKGLDPATGRELWSSDDALTQYNAPTLVNRADGACALVARGGPHAVPERPVGVSLVRLTGPEAGPSESGGSRGRRAGLRVPPRYP